MIRPFTCVCLVLAAGSGLYLYQVKQRAFALDASLRSTFHDIDVSRERMRMLRADWQLVNDPERLQALAGQYLTLQPMQPSQLLTMDQLATALPTSAPAATATAPAPAPVPNGPASGPLGARRIPVLDSTDGVPMADAAPLVPPHTHPVTPEVALLQPAAPQPEVAAPVPAPRAVKQPADFAVEPLLPHAPAATAAHVAATPAKAGHHWVHHLVPQAQPWLAETTTTPLTPRRHSDHHATPARQFYAANVPPRMSDPAARITPQAANVMYRPASSGSSLGMAASAELAPPRPLYSTSQ